MNWFVKLSWNINFKVKINYREKKVKINFVSRITFSSDSETKHGLRNWNKILTKMQIKLPSVDWGWDSWTSSMLKKKKFLRKWKVVRLKYELKEEQENSRRHLRWPDRFMFVCHSTVSLVCMRRRF